MTKDWSEEFALWDTIYPNRDWRRMTPSNFVAHLKHMNYVVRVLSGTWDDKDALQKKVDLDNRRILVMKRFPYIFKGYDEIS